MKWNAVLLCWIVVIGAMAVNPPQGIAQSPQLNTAARSLFMEGRDLWDDGKFAEAEKKFREALTKYPKADQSDRTAYYLITTLVKLGRVADANAEIESFNKNYPQSTWKSDVEEKRIGLTGAPVLGKLVSRGANFHVMEPLALNLQGKGTLFNGINAQAGLDGRVIVQYGNPSLAQEILRVILERDPDRGIAAAKERLKVDASDPAVIANLGAIANSSSSQALPFILSLVGSAATPNTRSQALYWMGRGSGDKSAVAKGLMDMLANSKDKETDVAVAEALARFNAMELRETIDKIVENNNIERFGMLEKIYRNSNSLLVRRQTTESAGQISDPKALSFLADVARNDRDMSVRRIAIQAIAARKETDTVKTLEELLKTLPPEAPRKK